MRAFVFAVVMVAAAPALGAPTLDAVPGSAPKATSPARAPIRLAQNCGWFAVLGCFGSRGEARRWSNRIEDGYVINTTSAAYPNFRPGFYCVVNGPTSYGTARSIAAGWRRVIPDAYSKNSC